MSLGLIGLLGYLSYTFRVFFSADIPWWVYLMVAIVLAVVALVAIPGKLGEVVAMAVLVLGTWIAAHAMGSAAMHRADLKEFDRQAAQEQQRLKKSFDAVSKEEQRQEALAKQEQEQLDRQAQDANTQAATLQPKDSNGNPVGVAVPEPVARGVCDLRFKSRWRSVEAGRSCGP